MMWEAQFIIVHKRLERRDLPAAPISKVVFCILSGVQSLNKNTRKKTGA